MSDGLSNAAVWLGIKHGTLVAGFCGALVSLSFLPGMSSAAKITSVCSGFVFAVFVGDGIADYFSANDVVGRAIVFGTGAFGLSIVPAAIEALKRVPEDIRQKFGGKQ